MQQDLAHRVAVVSGYQLATDSTCGFQQALLPLSDKQRCSNQRQVTFAALTLPVHGSAASFRSVMDSFPMNSQTPLITTQTCFHSARTFFSGTIKIP